MTIERKNRPERHNAATDALVFGDHYASDLAVTQWCVDGFYIEALEWPSAAGGALFVAAMTESGIWFRGRISIDGGVSFNDTDVLLMERSLDEHGIDFSTGRAQLMISQWRTALQNHASELRHVAG